MACPDSGDVAKRVLAACLSATLWPLAAGAEVDPTELAQQVAELGPRVGESAAKREAVRVLRDAMEAAGLQQVRLLPVEGHPELRQLEGSLPGESGLEILLTAHLDSVAHSPGAADDAAGCAVVIAASGRLAKLPRRHGLRVVLFDGEENGLAGSRAWVGSLDRRQKQSILGAVNVDLVGWRETGRSAVLPLLTENRLRIGPPAWLVAAVLAASRSVGEPLSVASSPVSLIGQVLIRSVDLVRASDAEALLAGGIPAITLSDADLFRSDPWSHRAEDTAERLSADRLETWTDRLGATVLRLDRLRGRPRDDDQYLVLFGRVLPRRDLYWLGIAVWIVLVFRGLPGAWRGTLRAERRHKGRHYLPGFAVRFVFLGSVLMLPVLASVLLVPAAVASVLPARLRLGPNWRLVVASVPLLASLAALLWLTVRGEVEAIAIGLPAAALLATTFASLVWLIVGEDESGLQPLRESSPSQRTADSHSSAEL
jgi:hypothetical protein